MDILYIRIDVSVYRIVFGKTAGGWGAGAGDVLSHHDLGAIPKALRWYTVGKVVFERFL